jgi:hypothetical protein
VGLELKFKLLIVLGCKGRQQQHSGFQVGSEVNMSSSVGERGAA